MASRRRLSHEDANTPEKRPIFEGCCCCSEGRIRFGIGTILLAVFFAYALYNFIRLLKDDDIRLDFREQSIASVGNPGIMVCSSQDSGDTHQEIFQREFNGTNFCRLRDASIGNQFEQDCSGGLELKNVTFPKRSVYGNVTKECVIMEPGALKVESAEQYLVLNFATADVMNNSSVPVSAFTNRLVFFFSTGEDPAIIADPYLVAANGVTFMSLARVLSKNSGSDVFRTVWRPQLSQTVPQNMFNRLLQPGLGNATFQTSLVFNMESMVESTVTRVRTFTEFDAIANIGGVTTILRLLALLILGESKERKRGVLHSWFFADPIDEKHLVRSNETADEVEADMKRMMASAQSVSGGGGGGVELQQIVTRMDGSGDEMRYRASGSDVDSAGEVE